MFSKSMTSVCHDISSGIIFFLYLIPCQTIFLAEDKCENRTSENINLKIAVVKLWDVRQGLSFSSQVCKSREDVRSI